MLLVHLQNIQAVPCRTVLSKNRQPALQLALTPSSPPPASSPKLAFRSQRHQECNHYQQQQLPIVTNTIESITRHN